MGMVMRFVYWLGFYILMTRACFRKKWRHASGWGMSKQYFVRIILMEQRVLKYGLRVREVNK
mgnify:CR=1 FL=1